MKKVEIKNNDDSYAADGLGSSTLNTMDSADVYNQWIVSLFRPQLGKKNLEFGAGKGTLSRLVAEEVILSVLDPATENFERLKQLKKSLPNILAVYDSVASIPERETFDCIFSSNVLEHIPDDAEALSQYARRLAIGGRLLAFVPAGGNLLYSSFDKVLGHHRRYGKKDVKRLHCIDVTETTETVLVEHRFLNVVGGLGWLVKMKIMKADRIDSQDVKLVERMLRITRHVDKLRLPFGQSAFLVWEKKERVKKN